MAIAANFRKFPQAMALQLVIQFGRPTWNTARPTTRHGRAVRAHITRTMKAIGLIIWPEAKAIPAWWKDGQKRARALYRAVKKDCIKLDFQKPLPAEKKAGMNAYRRMIWQNRVNAGTAAWA